MDNDQREIFIERVIAYVRAYHERMPHSGLPIEPGSVWKGRPVRLEYDAVRSYLQNLPRAQAAYSAETLEEIQDGFLTNALEDEDAIPALAASLVDQLAQPIASRFYAPIDGLDLDADAYDIGAIRIIKMLRDVFEERVVTPYAAIIRANPRFANDVDAMSASLRTELEPLIGRVCIEVPTSTDMNRTFEFASRDAIGDACDFLQYAEATRRAHDPHLKIRWATQARELFRHAFAVSDKPNPNARRQQNLASVAQPMIFDKALVDQMKSAGTDRLADLVARELATEYDELLRRSVRWFAKGEREDHNDDRKLSYVTAIDLFLSQPGGQVTERICKGFAIVMASVYAQLDATPHFGRYMLRVFQSRSATSHGGDLDLLDDSDIESLRRHCHSFIAAMCQMGFSTRTELREWLSRQESTLTEDVRKQLDNAVDWKMDRDERLLKEIAGILRAIVSQDLLKNPKTATRSIKLAAVLRDAARSSGKFVKDLQPHLEGVREATESLRVDIENGQYPGRADAAGYCNRISDCLGKVKWVASAME